MEWRRLCALASKGLPYQAAVLAKAQRRKGRQGETPTTMAPFNSQKPSTHGVAGFFPSRRRRFNSAVARAAWEYFTTVLWVETKFMSPHTRLEN
jgi:hypothetical protein